MDHLRSHYHYQRFRNANLGTKAVLLQIFCNFFKGRAACNNRSITLIMNMLHRLQQRKIVQKATAHRVHNVFQKLQLHRKNNASITLIHFFFLLLQPNYGKYEEVCLETISLYIFSGHWLQPS
jgi:hypothetical protein